jgi:hypothetical protein
MYFNTGFKIEGGKIMKNRNQIMKSSQYPDYVIDGFLNYCAEKERYKHMKLHRDNEIEKRIETDEKTYVEISKIYSSKTRYKNLNS